MGIRRPWYLLSSSSGETLKALWQALDEPARAECIGFFFDRDCGSAQVAQSLPGRKGSLHVFPKGEFERSFLEVASADKEAGFLGAHNEALALLCGFFAILSKPFLEQAPVAFVNTHPSLLPAFPGLDQRVHEQVFGANPLSGFSLHLVNEELDGGPVLFQQPVWVGDCLNPQELRARVRQTEQTLLPRLWTELLGSGLLSSDRKKSSREVASKHSLFGQAYFQSESLKNKPQQRSP